MDPIPIQWDSAFGFMCHFFKHTFLAIILQAPSQTLSPPPLTGVADPEVTYNLCLNLKLSYKNRVTNMTAT